jgi:hypothetical protein
MRSRRARGEEVLGELLAGERRGLGGQRLGIGGHLAGDVARRVAAVLNGEQRLAAYPVEKVDPTLLGGLRHGVHHFAVVLYGDEAGRSGEIAIPEIVSDSLKVPDALAGVGFQRQQGVGEQVVAHAVGAIEIAGCRAGGDIECRASGRPPCRPSCWPRRCRSRRPWARCRSRTRRGGEPCGNSSAACRCERRRRGYRRWGRAGPRECAADDQQVLINDAGAGEDDGLLFGIAAQSFAQVDAAALPKSAIGLPVRASIA